MKRIVIFLFLLIASLEFISAIDCSNADYNIDGEVNFKDSSLFEVCHNQDASQVQIISSTENVRCEFWDFNSDGYVDEEDIIEYESTYLKECPDHSCLNTIGELTIAPLGQWTYIDINEDILHVQVLRGGSEDFKLVGLELKIDSDGSEKIETWQKESFFGKNAAKLFDFPGYADAKSIELFPKVILHGEETTCDSVELMTISTSDREEISCIDTDTGINYYIKGSVTKKHLSSLDIGSNPDYCLGEPSKILMEGYCEEDGSFSREEFECPDGCSNGACIESNIVETINEEEIEDKKIQEEVKVIPAKFYIQNKEAIVKRNAEGKNIIEIQGKQVETSLDIIEDSEKIYIKTSEGNEEIKVSFEEAISKAKKIDEIKNIVISEENGDVVYVLSGTKKARLFFIFSINADISQNVNIEDGSITSTKKPWWHIFAFGI